MDCRNTTLGRREKSLEQKKGAEHAERQSNRTLGGKRLDEKEYLLYSHTGLDF